MTSAIMALAGLSCVLTAGQYLQPLVYDYRLTEQGVDFMLFRLFRLWTIRFADIQTLKQIPVWALFFGPDAKLALYLRNRLFGKTIFLRRKSGLLRQIVITPADPAGFLQLAHSHFAAGCI